MNPWLIVGTPIMAMRRSKATTERYSKSLSWSTSVGWYPGVEGERRRKARRLGRLHGDSSLHDFWWGTMEASAQFLAHTGWLWAFRRLRKSLLTTARNAGATGNVLGFIVWPTEYDTYALGILLAPNDAGEVLTL